MPGPEHFGVGGGRVRFECNWKCGDALGAAVGVSGGPSRPGVSWWNEEGWLAMIITSNWEMKTKENDDDDDDDDDDDVDRHIHIHKCIHIIVLIRHNKPWMNKKLMLWEASVLEEAWLVRFLSTEEFHRWDWWDFGSFLHF